MGIRAPSAAHSAVVWFATASRPRYRTTRRNASRTAALAVGGRPPSGLSRNQCRAVDAQVAHRYVARTRGTRAAMCRSVRYVRWTGVFRSTGSASPCGRFCGAPLEGLGGEWLGRRRVRATQHDFELVQHDGCPDVFLCGGFSHFCRHPAGRRDQSFSRFVFRKQKVSFDLGNGRSADCPEYSSHGGRSVSGDGTSFWTALRRVRCRCPDQRTWGLFVSVATRTLRGKAPDLSRLTGVDQYESSSGTAPHGQSPGGSRKMATLRPPAQYRS